MSFIASGGPAAPPENDTLPNSPWWPAVSFAAWRAASRIDRTAQDPQALAALGEGIARVNAQLNGWFGIATALARTQPPYIEASTLADLPDPPHQAPGWCVARYLRAVHCYADSLLAESLRDFDSTAEGHQRADAMEGRIDAYRREAQYAIADIIDMPRRRVELL